MDRFIELKATRQLLARKPLKSNMDRFIDALALQHFSTLALQHTKSLKSNMDIFLGRQTDKAVLSLTTLKSNMDRFIE